MLEDAGRRCQTSAAARAARRRGRARHSVPSTDAFASHSPRSSEAPSPRHARAAPPARRRARRTTAGGLRVLRAGGASPRRHPGMLAVRRREGRPAGVRFARSSLASSARAREGRRRGARRRARRPSSLRDRARSVKASAVDALGGRSVRKRGRGRSEGAEVPGQAPQARAGAALSHVSSAMPRARYRRGGCTAYSLSDEA